MGGRRRALYFAPFPRRIRVRQQQIARLDLIAGNPRRPINAAPAAAPDAFSTAKFLTWLLTLIQQKARLTAGLFYCCNTKSLRIKYELHKPFVFKYGHIKGYRGRGRCRVCRCLSFRGHGMKSAALGAHPVRGKGRAHPLMLRYPVANFLSA